MTRDLSERGARLAISARREEQLNRIAADCSGPRPLVVPVDVTDRERVDAAVEEVVDEYGGIDLAILNAGVFGTLGKQAFDAEVYEWNMDVNYLGTVRCIDAALPHLRDSEDGYVVGMSSGAAYGPLARGSAYGPSKTAVKYLFDSLSHEWNQKGVDVDLSVVCPGVVETPMTEDDDFPYDPPTSFFEVSPEWAADYILDGMEKRSHEIRFPATFILMLKLFGMIPNPLHRWIMKLVDRMTVKEELRP